MSAIKREIEFSNAPSIQIITYAKDGVGPSPSQTPKVMLKLRAFCDVPEHAFYFTKSEGERFARILLDATKDL